MPPPRNAVGRPNGLVFSIFFCLSVLVVLVVLVVVLGERGEGRKNGFPSMPHRKVGLAWRGRKFV